MEDSHSVAVINRVKDLKEGVLETVISPSEEAAVDDRGEEVAAGAVVEEEEDVSILFDNFV